MILGLDISSNKTGISCLDLNGDLKFFDFIDTRTNTKAKKEEFEDLMDKIDEVVSYLEDFYTKNPLAKEITHIYIEDALSKFTPGFSSIHTLAVLFKTNFAVSYQLYRLFGIKPIYINTRVAASSNGIKIPPKSDKKKLVMDFIKGKYKNFANMIPEKLSKDSPWFDVSDSVLIARSGWIQNHKQ